MVETLNGSVVCVKGELLESPESEQKSLESKDQYLKQDMLQEQTELERGNYHCESRRRRIAKETEELHLRVFYSLKVSMGIPIDINEIIRQLKMIKMEPRSFIILLELILEGHKIGGLAAKLCPFGVRL